MTPELSVVVPVFNEEAVLPELYRQLVPVLDEAAARWELVLVNDGSRDGSLAIMQSLRDEDERVTLINLSRNFGHQLAITAGMEHALGDAVVVMDADLQDPPEVILEMVARWREGFDVVYGVRSEREAETLFKRFTAAAFYRVLNALTPVQIPLDTGDFRLMSRRALDALSRMPERARFVRGMVAWLGFRQTGITFKRRARFAGRTKYPVSKMVGFAADSLISFSTVPLRIASTLGFVMSVGALGYFGYAASMKIMYGHTAPGWASLIAVIVLLGSAQLLCLGIIGEYVGRIYEEVKARPLFVVERLEQGAHE
ncbi:MAG: glycosyltransferase [Deltaproteobacteria bacterium]|nr:MAG: glycosyltransferase [Deltaproteobacteria bacterium]